MLLIRDHGVDDYTALRDMDATDVGDLTEDDRDCLRELGEYLVATEASQRFAMWLLHKHFEPTAGEVFVERAIPEWGMTETKLVERSAFSAEGLRATGIRFGVKLIRDPLGLSEGELLLETCDTAERTLYCDVSVREAIPADLSVIETTWRWKVVRGETRPVVMQDCTAGCVSVGEGHDLSHKHSQTDNDDNPIP